MVCRIYAAVGHRSAAQISLTKVKSHVCRRLEEDPLVRYFILGNSQADLAAKAVWKNASTDEQSVVNSFREYAETQLTLTFHFSFCPYLVALTSTDEPATPVDRLLNWSPAQVRMFVTESSESAAQSCLMGPPHGSALLACLHKLEWPCQVCENDPQITWFELLLDYQVATGRRMPYCKGLLHRQPLLHEVLSDDESFLLEDDLVKQIDHFRRTLVATHYVSDQPLFPRERFITYAGSLCAFPFGVRLAGFKVRPKLARGQIVLDSLHKFFWPIGEPDVTSTHYAAQG